MGSLLLAAELADAAASLERYGSRLREVAAIDIIAHINSFAFTVLNLLGRVAVRTVSRTVYQNGLHPFFDGHLRTLSDIRYITRRGDLT